MRASFKRKISTETPNPIACKKPKLDGPIITKDAWSVIARYLSPLDRMSLARAIPNLQQCIQSQWLATVPEKLLEVMKKLDVARIHYKICGSGLSEMMLNGVVTKGKFKIFIPKVDPIFFEKSISAKSTVSRVLSQSSRIWCCISHDTDIDICVIYNDREHVPGSWFTSKTLCIYKPNFYK